MKTRQKWGMISLAVLLLIGFGSHHIPELSHENMPSYVILIYLIFLCCAAFAALYEKKNFEGKVWDFNPKRGFLFFCIGFLIFPIIAAIDALFGADLSLEGMIIFTLAGSTFVGVLGIFTDHVGV
ncbi:MAG: hypothetical protein AAGE37_07490 [Pseudomonadota bacterium]